MPKRDWIDKLFTNDTRTYEERLQDEEDERREEEEKKEWMREMRDAKAESRLGDDDPSYSGGTGGGCGCCSALGLLTLFGALVLLYFGFRIIIGF